jgi:hypothetical protein
MWMFGRNGRSDAEKITRTSILTTLANSHVNGHLTNYKQFAKFWTNWRYSSTDCPLINNTSVHINRHPTYYLWIVFCSIIN